MEIVQSTGFFYDHEIEIAVELVTERLTHGESTGYYFVFAEVQRVSQWPIPAMVLSPCLKRALIFTGSLPITITAVKE